jgi:hypothetical protein
MAPSVASFCWVVREDALAVAARGDSGRRRSSAALRRDAQHVVFGSRAPGPVGNRETELGPQALCCVRPADDQTAPRSIRQRIRIELRFLFALL